MKEEKTYINKDLYNESEQSFYNNVNNDFIGDDFIEQLEWSMLIIQNNFKQIRLAPYIPDVTASHFDKAFLMSSGLNDNIKFLTPFSDSQVTPDIFPMINIKFMTILDTISLAKIKEMDIRQKSQLGVKNKYSYEYSMAFYRKDTESFYATKEGYGVNKSFFNLGNIDKITKNDIPNPISLHPNYRVPDNAFLYLPNEQIVQIIKHISMAYQVAMTMYYEWTVYIKEYDNIGFTIPIEPGLLSEIYKTSILNFDDKKRMLHFVRDHYRRKPKSDNNDYSIYVSKYLRGEYKFNYRGFYAEIIPPKYDLNRVKTKKKFINTLSD